MLHFLERIEEIGLHLFYDYIKSVMLCFIMVLRLSISLSLSMALPSPEFHRRPHQRDSQLPHEHHPQLFLGQSR